jgi:hypothetical protein
MAYDATNTSHVKDATRRERRRRRRFMDAVREVLNTPAGRLMFGERELGLLARCGVYRSVWEQSSRIHYNAGRQDVGHELMAIVTEADEAAYLTMEHEMRTLAQRDRNEADASVTDAASERG